MNTEKKTSLLTKSILGLSLLTTFAWSSCDHKDVTPPAPTTFLSILHAAPGRGAVDIALNGQQITNKALGYGLGGAINIKPDNYKVSFIAPGSGTEIANAEDSLGVDALHSAILYGTGADTKVMLIKDVLEQPSNPNSSFPYLRFLNLSPGSQNVKVMIGQDEYASGRSFADNIEHPELANFKTITTGTYSFTVLTNEGDTLGQLKNQALNPGGAYTVFLDGYENAPQEEDTIAVYMVRSY